MKRSLCAFALLALAAIPDWASACWLPRSERVAYRRAHVWRPIYRQSVYRQPVYCQPVYQPVYVQTCVPATHPHMLVPPRIEPVKQRGSDGPNVEAPRPLARPEVAPPAPPIKPVGGTEQPIPETRVSPEPKIPPPPNPKPTPEPKIPPLELPKDNPEPKLPPLELPKSGEPKLPPLELPIKPDAKPPIEVPKETNPKLPPLELPKDSGSKPLELPKSPEPKTPPVESPGSGTAVPVPAPAPDILTPPASAPKEPNSLPSLVLPPDSPVSPAPMKPTIVKSSPISPESSELKVSVFPAAGTTDLRGPLRKVGFFNHTDRDLMLTIEGKTVKLPAKTFIHAQVPATFTWKYGDKPATTATVPADAAGLDVLFRE
ncbi:MAG: hypothetical protein L0241_28000 [Planctomycetia bacterium]|nr:hypothetical protein [Planctomycetia bacterium]